MPPMLPTPVGRLKIPSDFRLLGKEKMERDTGFEPATSTLAIRHSEL